MPAKKTARKIKNVLIISASFRPNSNSHALCQEVAKGVKAAGNKAEVVRLKDRKIGFRSRVSSTASRARRLRASSRPEASTNPVP
jgi:NAD(P)H-dependent FMN reductase